MTDSKIPQSNSALKREARKKNANQKSFGGKLIGFKDNKERHFNQRMLKAYLSGHTQFQFGKSLKKNHLGMLELTPDWHDVLLTDKTVDINAIDKLLANGYCDPGKVFGGVSLGKGQLNKLLRKRAEEKRKAEKESKKPKDGFRKRIGF